MSQIGQFIRKSNHRRTNKICDLVLRHRTPKEKLRLRSIFIQSWKSFVNEKDLNFLEYLHLGINIFEKKKAKIILVQGFHPFEDYAIRVGERIRETFSNDGVEVISYTPKSIGNDYLNLIFDFNFGEIAKRNRQAVKELRNHIKSLYEKYNFLIVLHSTPRGFEDFQYEVSYPAWNLKLSKVVKDFENYCKGKGTRLVGIPQSPIKCVSYHSSHLVFNINAQTKNDKYYLRDEEGVSLTLEFIDWINKNYIKS